MFENLERRCLMSVALQSGTLVILGSASSDHYELATTEDLLQVQENGTAYEFALADVSLISARLGPGDDTLDLWGVAIPSEIFAGQGDDSVNGGAGNDILHGRRGRDTLIGNEGDDVIHGDQGSDSLRIAQTHYEPQPADDGTIAIGLKSVAEVGHDSLFGGAGDDSLSIGDTLAPVGSGSFVMYGQSGDDVLDGYTGPAKLRGGLGNDRLIALGTIEFRGGAGADRIRYNPDNGNITDRQDIDIVTEERRLYL